MNKIKISLENNDLELFSKECAENTLNDKAVLNLVKQTIKENKIEFFKVAMNTHLEPYLFWSIHKNLLKDNNHEFLKIMITINQQAEHNEAKKNMYVDELLFEFIAKDDLVFVDYLVTKKNASTENMDESESSLLNECSKHNAIKCFDYFLSRGKSLHDFQDVALYSALHNRHYKIVELIVSADPHIDNDIAQNLFRYGIENNKEEMTSKHFKSLEKAILPAINQNFILQNALNYQYVKKGLIKKLEENLKLGHSPIGDDHHNLMSVAIMLNVDALKMAKLLLDYGGEITQVQKTKLASEELEEIENYPRFSRIKKNLENKFPLKGKEKVRKI